jgi:hypothetical protein
VGAPVWTADREIDPHDRTPLAEPDVSDDVAGLAPEHEGPEGDAGSCWKPIGLSHEPARGEPRPHAVLGNLERVCRWHGPRRPSRPLGIRPATSGSVDLGAEPRGRRGLRRCLGCAGASGHRGFPGCRNATQRLGSCRAVRRRRFVGSVFLPAGKLFEPRSSSAVPRPVCLPDSGLREAARDRASSFAQDRTWPLPGPAATRRGRSLQGLQVAASDPRRVSNGIERQSRLARRLSLSPKAPPLRIRSVPRRVVSARNSLREVRRVRKWQAGSRIPVHPNEGGHRPSGFGVYRPAT